MSNITKQERQEFFEEDSEEEEIITEKEKRELIVGFIQHVFEEVQTEGWKKRRD